MSQTTNLVCLVCEGKCIVGRLVETYDADLQRIVPTIVDARCSHCIAGYMTEQDYAELTGASQ